jgi:hypothetical protein
MTFRLTIWKNKMVKCFNLNLLNLFRLITFSFLFLSFCYQKNLTEIIQKENVSFSFCFRRIRVPQDAKPFDPNKALEIIRKNKGLSDQEIKERIEQELGCDLLEFIRLLGERDPIFLLVVNESETYMGSIATGIIIKKTDYFVSREPSGFVISCVNSIATIEGLTTLTGIPIEELEEIMRPGAYSVAGFIGRDESLISVLRDDNIFVLSQDLTHQGLAMILHAPSSYGDIKEETLRTMGYQDSVFSDGLRTEHDDYYTNLDTGMKMRFSGLLPDYIERYGFYEGDTVYRLSPEEIMDFAGIEFKFVSPGKRLRTGEVLTAEQAEMVNNRIREYLAIKRAKARIMEIVNKRPLIVPEDDSTSIIEGFDNGITRKAIQNLNWLLDLGEFVGGIYLPNIWGKGLEKLGIISENAQRFLTSTRLFSCYLGGVGLYDLDFSMAVAVVITSGIEDDEPVELSEDWFIEMRRQFKEAVLPLFQKDYETINKIFITGDSDKVFDLIDQLSDAGRYLYRDSTPYEIVSFIEKTIPQLKEEVANLIREFGE